MPQTSTTDLRQQAIPKLPEPDWTQLGLIAIAALPQPLVPMSLAPMPVRVYPAYARMEVPGAVHECYVREEVYRRLLAVARALPSGLTLLVLDGWRPWRVQQYLFETLSTTISEAEPGISEAELLERTREFVSLPSTAADAPSPHLTGGAVDVTLCDADGLPLDMGSTFDEASQISHTATFEERLNLSAEQIIARDNRRLLYHSMLAQGFTNLPSEWWHFDFGDQLWAWYSGRESALYGPAEPDTVANRWKRQFGRADSPTDERYGV
ncbi:M15 family metallopeptidase [Halomonas huangheensis]|uniref:D-alanyl-D-alanine dipeptidase n=1 Tax=Halomonas huangheensis TaxID=1178482 RepID=W1N8G0_9GAMM|nr:M15 family metallopeptidase [Halomonas huangheensis]ERL51215.1 hypothetical protein BJB45_15040 [Halomonas huangheensis]